MLLTLLMLLDIKAWKMGQPPENVWVTLAKTLRQDNLCLSMGSVSSPLSSCLVGIPFKINEPSPLHPFAGNWPALPTAEKGPAREAWEQWVKLIPKATTDAHKENPVANSEPQELDLLVSAKASYSFNFYFQNMASSYKNQSKPLNKIYNLVNWCNYTTKIPFDTSGFLIPRALPKGVFLICGDRAWAGIPSRIQGGPCTFGRLKHSPQTLLSYKNGNKRINLPIQKDPIPNLTKILMPPFLIGVLG
ncbi:hypothetical protein DUI87_06374 [Hirundo rustica rustica]|uniref:Uncharacterized protein n=1 Tax=Hirundo rustica rustica TaxID=333673 RepID=A0A3M0L199_HIRRU|nr:hypothetical protein DUI87_06374 [Hirundo rustica rustica]